MEKQVETKPKESQWINALVATLILLLESVFLYYGWNKGIIAYLVQYDITLFALTFVQAFFVMLFLKALRKNVRG